MMGGIMKMPISKSTSQLIDTINWLIAKNRKTLSISDVELLESVKLELNKLTKKRVKTDNTEIRIAMIDITQKLMRFFIDNGFIGWKDLLN